MRVLRRGRQGWSVGIRPGAAVTPITIAARGRRQRLLDVVTAAIRSRPSLAGGRLDLSSVLQPEFDPLSGDAIIMTGAPLQTIEQRIDSMPSQCLDRRDTTADEPPRIPVA